MQKFKMISDPLFALGKLTKKNFIEVDQRKKNVDAKNECQMFCKCVT